MKKIDTKSLLGTEDPASLEDICATICGAANPPIRSDDMEHAENELSDYMSCLLALLHREHADKPYNEPPAESVIRAIAGYLGVGMNKMKPEPKSVGKYHNTLFAPFYQAVELLRDELEEELAGADDAELILHKLAYEALQASDDKTLKTAAHAEMVYAVLKAVENLGGERIISAESGATRQALTNMLDSSNLTALLDLPLRERDNASRDGDSVAVMLAVAGYLTMPVDEYRVAKRLADTMFD